MEKEFDFRNHQVGDKVYHITRGWVKIEHKEKGLFFVDRKSYYYNGKFVTIDENPTIYPYNPFEGRIIEVNTGFHKFEPRELIKVLTNDKVLCWDQEKEAAYVFNKWREIEPKKELTTEEKVLILWKKFQENGR